MHLEVVGQVAARCQRDEAQLEAIAIRMFGEFDEQFFLAPHVEAAGHMHDAQSPGHTPTSCKSASIGEVV